MNPGVNKLPDHDAKLWAKWLRATGVDEGYGYRVPEEVWSAVWYGNWPTDQGSIRWILEEYLDVEMAKAHGYLELVIPLREQAEAALDTAKNNIEQQRQIKIDADIDEIIKTIEGLGLKPDEKTTAIDSRGGNSSPRRTRWMRLAVRTITTFAIGAFAGFVGAYNLHAPNAAGHIRFGRPPEIRRAIPVEPEIRRAIPRAIPVRTIETGNQIGWPDSTAFISPRKGIPRDSATRRKRSDEAHALFRMRCRSVDCGMTGRQPSRLQSDTPISRR